MVQLGINWYKEFVIKLMGTDETRNIKAPVTGKMAALTRNHIHLSRALMAVLAICALTVIVYYPVANFDFVDLDDDAYVFQNEQVQRGVTLEGIAYAFQTFEMANWMPLTWLSYMVDVDLFGESPASFHLVNVAIHMVNALLLFFFLKMATSRIWPSVFVAALFAVHPLHVESVAWISERKDVLSTFFWMLCNLTYMRYSRHPGVAGYIGVVTLFILGLAAKPMLVTLPIVLLLLDYWPLARIPVFRVTGNTHKCKPVSTSFVLLEKVPMLLLSLVFGVVTLMAQNSFSAVQSVERLPLATRIANALVSYVGYLGKMVWPDKLTVLYPYPENISTPLLVFALLFIISVSSGALIIRKRCPYFIFGWLWYLVTLLPVIGFIQVGNQAMADRYTYVPLTGIFIIIAWGGRDLSSKWRLGKSGLTVLGVALVAVLAVTARAQVNYWKDSVTLFSHTLSVTQDNYLAENALARGYEKQGDLEAAVKHYRRALGKSPGYTAARYNLGNVYLKLGKLDAAIEQYTGVLKRDPEDLEALNNLGKALVGAGRIPEAIQQYQRASSLAPDRPGLLSNMGVALIFNGQLVAAEKVFAAILCLDPGYADAYYYQGYIYELRGMMHPAGRYYSLALQVDPNHKLAPKGRARIIKQLKPARQAGPQAE